MKRALLFLGVFAAVAVAVLFFCRASGPVERAAPSYSLVKFDQPAAGMDPSTALTDDCDICDTYPIVVGSTFTQYWYKCTYITHDEYWPVTYATAYRSAISQNQLDWVNTRESTWIDWMWLLSNYSYDPAGNYCRVAGSCGNFTWYQLVPFPGSCGVGNTRIYVSDSDYAAIVAAANGMTCAQCFIRSTL